MTKSKFLLALIAGLALSLPASAKTYKWVDDKGVTHMGDTIPAEYANKDRQLLNKSGVVVKTQDVLTPEERRLKEAETAKVNSEEAAVRDQKLHDKSLTDTYSSVNEIELSRKRSLQQIDARIDSISSQIKITSNNLMSLQAQNRGNAKVPAHIQEETRATQERLDRLQHDLDKFKAEKAAVEARYDADKARYKALTGK